VRNNGYSVTKKTGNRVALVMGTVLV